MIFRKTTTILTLNLIRANAFPLGPRPPRFLPSDSYLPDARGIGTYSTSTSSLHAAIPEPGPCPTCSDENGYWDGSTNFVCITCAHEWPVDSPAEDEQGGGDGIVRDSNGNVLAAGDTVVLTKELGKGLKKGMKVTRIRIGDYGDGHDVEASIPGMGTYALKSQFLKKTK